MTAVMLVAPRVMYPISRIRCAGDSGDDGPRAMDVVLQDQQMPARKDERNSRVESNSGDSNP